MDKQRVVITGMGVVAASAHGLDAFAAALRAGKSGIRHHAKLAELGFACQVGGIPEISEAVKREYFSETALLAMNASMIYAGIAGIDCWRDAGFVQNHDSPVDWDTGAIIGTGIGGADTLGDFVVPMVSAGKVRRLGSTTVEQTMCSSVSAWLGGALGLGGQVTTNSSACTTGTEAIVNAFYAVQEGRSLRMLAGGTEGSSHYIWAGFDAMRVLARGFNENPTQASRPMSATAAGFVPSSGSGIVMVESLDSAQKRGAKIYAEIIGAQVNSGGHRGGGSMTAPNPEGVVRCVRQAVLQAGITSDQVDIINGHLTATMADPMEVKNWLRALECAPENFPLIQSTKSMVGHALGAAGGVEAVASLLQLHHGFVHGSLNCEDVHPGLESIQKSIVHTTRESDAKILAKSSFGFGDVNGCLIFKKWLN
ncbi:MAG: beta-ketoacyl-[acyl-carrier-protein] synthase family protein [Bdellovibrionota bacterium]